MTPRARTDLATGLVAALGGCGVGLLYAEPVAWSVGTTLVVLLIGAGVGAVTRGAAQFIGFLVIGVLAGGVVVSLDHAGLAPGGFLSAIGGVLVGKTLRSMTAER